MSEMSKLLKELDLTLDAIDEAGTLVLLRDRYEGMVKQAEKASDEQESVLKQTVSLLNQDEDLVRTVKETFTSLLEIVHPLIDGNPKLAILFAEMAGDFKQAMMNERDHFMGKSVVPIAKKVKEASEDAVAKREQAGKLRRMIELVFDWQGRPAKIKGFPVKKSANPAIGHLPDISKLPRKESDGEVVVGMAARNRKLRFRVNGEDLPADTTPADLAYTHVSDRQTGNYISWSAITSLIKESGQQVGGELPWKVEIAGKTVEGWKVND